MEMEKRQDNILQNFTFEAFPNYGCMARPKSNMIVIDRTLKTWGSGSSHCQLNWLFLDGLLNLCDFNF